MNNEITTILFDLDGTLIDTNELIISSFLHTLDKYYPNQYGREDVIPFMGPTLVETFSAIDPEKVDEMIDTYRTYNKANHDLLVTAFAGAFETLQALKKAGKKLAIVTSKMADVATMGLKLTKIEPFFDAFIALDHVTKSKPDPEPLLKALELLHADPSEAMMVGDNHHDVLAGKNAGTKTVAVAWSLKGKEYLQSLHPDYVIDSMNDLLPILGVEKE